MLANSHRFHILLLPIVVKLCTKVLGLHQSGGCQTQLRAHQPPWRPYTGLCTFNQRGGPAGVPGRGDPSFPGKAARSIKEEPARSRAERNPYQTEMYVCEHTNTPIFSRFGKRDICSVPEKHHLPSLECSSLCNLHNKAGYTTYCKNVR